ncbi:MAG: hypothetical protein AAFX53_10575 [Bacteroidota bacterium]
MKRIQKILCALVAVIFMVSCEDDGGTSKIELEDGAAPDMAISPNTPAFIDLLSLEAGEAVNLQYSADVAQGNPTSIDIIGVYTKSLASGGDVYRAVLASDVTLPQDFSLSDTEIVSAFSELNSTDDIGLGDVLSISTRFTMDDGRVLDIIAPTVESSTGTQVPVGGTGTNIATTVLFTSVINYPVSCPSDIGGTYLVSSTATGCCGVAPITDYEFTVTVTDNGGGSYSLSDMSGGMYDGLFCIPFAICGDASGGNITDICNELSGSAADCCGDNITFEGTVNPDGSWNVTITSGFVAGTSVWVKQ